MFISCIKYPLFAFTMICYNRVFSTFELHNHGSLSFLESKKNQPSIPCQCLHRHLYVLCILIFSQFIQYFEIGKKGLNKIQECLLKSFLICFSWKTSQIYWELSNLRCFILFFVIYIPTSMFSTYKWPLFRFLHTTIYTHSTTLTVVLSFILLCWPKSVNIKCIRSLG